MFQPRSDAAFVRFWNHCGSSFWFFWYHCWYTFFVHDLWLNVDMFFLCFRVRCSWIFYIPFRSRTQPAKPVPKAMFCNEFTSCCTSNKYDLWLFPRSVSLPVLAFIFDKCWHRCWLRFGTPFGIRLIVLLWSLLKYMSDVVFIALNQTYVENGAWFYGSAPPFVNLFPDTVLYIYFWWMLVAFWLDWWSKCAAFCMIWDQIWSCLVHVG